jgi:hypothetical protein
VSEPHPGLRMSDFAAPSGQAHRPDAGITGAGGQLRPCACGRLWNGPHLRYVEQTGEMVAVERDPERCPACQPPIPMRAEQP